MSSLKDTLSNLLGDDKLGMEIMVGIGFCFVIWVIVFVSSSLVNKVKSSLNDNPVLLSGLVDGQHAHEVKQDPNYEGSKNLLRSINENGIEYSYSMWIYINGDTWAGSNTKWKHVMHKGPRMQQVIDGDEPHNFCPIQCPGLWIHPNKNTMRLYVNTYDTNEEYVDIDNLPVRKWIHFVYTQSNFTSNIYINGRLKTSHNLATLPRQNYYNLWITQDSGFNGYLSTTQYFNKVLDAAHIHDLSVKGPTLEKHREERYNNSNDLTSKRTAYLSNRWWINDATFN